MINQTLLGKYIHPQNGWFGWLSGTSHCFLCGGFTAGHCLHCSLVFLPCFVLSKPCVCREESPALLCACSLRPRGPGPAGLWAHASLSMLTAPVQGWGVCRGRDAHGWELSWGNRHSGQAAVILWFPNLSVVAAGALSCCRGCEFTNSSQSSPFQVTRVCFYVQTVWVLTHS